MITPITEKILLTINPATGKTPVGPYASDTGCDLHVPRGTDVRAVADGTIVYSEPGHTPWVACPEHPYDTANSILLRLNEPFRYAGKIYNYAWYTHLLSLAYRVPDGGPGRRVKQWEQLGKTGTGNDDPHLHFGLLVHRQQAEGDYMDPLVLGHVIRALAKGVKP